MSTRSDDESGFLGRWARRKAEARQGRVDDAAAPPPAPPVAAKSAAGAAGVSAEPSSRVPEPELARANEAPQPPPPTLEDVAGLRADAADFSRFVAPRVAPEVQRAALKKLFSDPHFNVMDGLDTYIDDYGKPDPLPAAWLRQLTQGRFAGLFDDEDEDKAKAQSSAQPIPTPPAGTSPALPVAADTPALASTPAAPDTALAAEPLRPTDEDPDLRLQPQPAAGPEGTESGAGAPTRRPA